MLRDDLGNRMKEYYEGAVKPNLIRRMPVIIRLDGCHFHTFTRGFEKPFDSLLMKAMQATTKYLCSNVQGCVLGYTQSDEITLVLVDYAKLTTDAWFNYDLQKVTSISAALATYAFNKFFAELCAEETDNAYSAAHKRARDNGAYFDSRAFNIPKEEVVNCIFWRQIDAERNSVAMLAQAHFSPKELQSKNVKEQQDMVAKDTGTTWEALPTNCKRGSCVIKEYSRILAAGDTILTIPENQFAGITGFMGTQGKFILGNSGKLSWLNFVYTDAAGKLITKDISSKRTCDWVIDNEIPRFVDDGRQYIEKLINVGE